MVARQGFPAEWVSPAREYEAWLKFRDLAEGSIELRVRHVNRFATFSEVGPFQATTGDVIIFLSSRKWSKAMLSSMRASLAVWFKWAVTSGKMISDPMLNVPKVKVPMGKPKPVSEEVFAAAVEAADPRTRLALRLAGEMGMRRAEVAQVHYDDVLSTDDGYLLKIIGKGDKERVIPVPKTLATALLDHIATHGRDGWAFPSSEKSGHMTPHWMGSMVSKVLPPGYTMHKLRHRALTQIYERTHDIVLTAGVAGHSSVNTTQSYYVAPNYSRMREALEGMSE